MKKLMRKLVLSSFALGLAVITLSTTTFAWYTNNVDVTANGVIAQSSTSGNALLLISEDFKSWGTSATVRVADLGDPDDPSDNIAANGSNGVRSMKPVAIEKGVDYVPADGENPATAAKDPTFLLWNNETHATIPGGSNSDYLTFELFFKVQADKAHELYLTDFLITNTTTTMPQKDVLTAGKESIGVGYTDSTYTADILRTLLVSTKVETIENNQMTATDYELYDPEALLEISDTLGTNFNAHTYYDAVMGLTGEDNAIGTHLPADLDYGATAWTRGTAYGELATKQLLGVLPAADTVNPDYNYIKVTFYVFINGWDTACFDAVQGQEFTITLNFDSKEVTA